MTIIKESGMISLLEVDDEEEDDEEDDDDEHGGFGLGSSFFSGIISHSSDGCTIGEGGTSGVDSIANSIADSMSSSLCNILLKWCRWWCFSCWSCKLNPSRSIE